MVRFAFCLVALLWACNEPLNLSGLCDTDGGNVCGSAAVTAAIDLTACFGDEGGATSTCRSTLDEAVAPGTNGCLVVERNGQQLYSALTWTDGALGARFLPDGLTLGATVDVALFLYSGIFDPTRCQPGGLTVDAACDGDCLVKLREDDVTLGENTRLTFSDGGACNAVRAEGSVLVETCDGLDNDCDGIADNGFGLTEGGAPATCTVGVGACAREGQLQCTADGAGTECNAQAGQPAPEICDSIDNDCDGSTDEGIPVDGCCEIGTMRRCGMEIGTCGTGTQTCEGQGAKGAFGPCLDAGGNPVIVPGQQVESCNGIDDDCDGSTDEDIILADGNAQEEGDQPVALGGECLGFDENCATNGVVVCENNLPACRLNPVVRGAELCDSQDNDCDGAVDEVFADQNLGEPCEAGQGACRQAGVFACADRNTVACNAMAGDPGNELCDNGEDDDCDGTTDEGFDQLNEACVSGDGVCRANGQLVCSASREALVCNAEAGMPGDELCDRLDNDCDGETDEDFDTTDDPQNCGACGRDCGPIVVNGVAGCEESECTVVACLEGFDNQDDDPLNGCECNPENDDLPDAEFTDTNCDGIDGDAERAIFVSVELGDDDNTGGQDDPFQTIAHAVEAAGILGRDVYLDAGTYDVTLNNPFNDSDRVGLVIPAGVSIYGGYRYSENDHSWIRGAREDLTTIITGAQRVLRFEGDQDGRQIVLANVEIVTGEATDHPNPTVGVAAINLGDSLTLRNVRIVTGAGLDGPDGVDGEDATALGNSGGPGVAGDSPQQAGGGGFPGANLSCREQQGGRGGDGRQGVNLAQAGAEGVTNPIQGGQPGAGGPPGEDGEEGQSGEHGDSTNGGTFVGRIDQASLLWVPRPAGNAQSGAPGGGGGGGGGGVVSGGGGGGGGGAGGCAGSGGRGARGGAMSVGLYVIGSVVHLQSVDISAGDGGDGGRGGHGGRREPGSVGGLGGAGADNGGRGGRGGDGGCGGHAGGGAAGSSFAIFRSSTSNIEQDLENSQVVFEDFFGVALNNQQAAAEAALSAGNPGAPGQGGGADRTDICGPQAPSGDPGIARLIGCCPLGPGANNCTRLTCE